ncbi:hypothetical protein EMIHUDRAFT_223819 [Emiliania huxleyi CCMP1516]|uniref:Serine/threonine-protein phosphatase 4 regulatory subunit 3-like central domain-containing protein n=2 Tax=Emiliania huxleyi TaxID=2903 RepID=A0A0D3KT96_EMIH1|nr:hypothetical protein EMIHUDRAFT_223819 [Emiliania huxleyi CCMP1516]EOD38981.1 hypothetical protein EMIHUDRAFT_223819 [Emiliania huxleyi CCMP1516]|eukprot:XP_005791410.1 hypothetical protein EMIHUDRAFT_223819 [Emiliania huxleyi CCMP1516]
MAEAESDDSRHRAKVYCLNSNGQWDDRGTGHAAVQYSPEDEAAFVVVVSEDDGSQVLLQARVHMEDIYQRQQGAALSCRRRRTLPLCTDRVPSACAAETIVSWNEPETGVDYALSFQDAEGCTDLWEQICSLQGREPDGAGGTSDAEGASSTAGSAGADTALQLPAAELRNVAAIADLLSEVPPFRRARLVELLLQSDYVPQLIAFSNNMQIVSSLANDETFLQSLRDKLADPSLSSEALHDALRLLQELTTIAKQLQLYNRSTFYRKFVLLASTQHEPALLRTCILSQRPGYELCHALIGVLVSPGGTGEKPQASEVLRALLDPDAMEGRERDEFLNLFYDEFVDKIAQPVAGKVSAGTGPLNGPTNGTSGARGGEGGAGSAEGDDPAEEAAGDVLSARQHVCELLCFFVTRHTYRIKYFILRNNVLCRVLRLAKVRDKGLVLAAIRFFRTCIGLKDEFYNRYIVKNRCFEPVVAQLLANLGRDNLVHSAILELLEFVRRENVRSLVAHLADAYGERFRTLKHVEPDNTQTLCKPRAAPTVNVVSHYRSPWLHQSCFVVRTRAALRRFLNARNPL